MPAEAMVARQPKLLRLLGNLNYLSISMMHKQTIHFVNAVFLWNTVPYTVFTLNPASSLVLLLSN